MSVSDADRQATKIVRAAFARRGIYTGLADVRVMHGIAIIRGTVTAAPGHKFADLKVELELLAKVLRSKPEIRDVVFDCNIKG